jgi:catechol 2,3-dioxygenase-like lactoylglutathione lyase family enzyme
MITGAHVLLYTPDADADRAFFRDVLGFPHVDVGHGWLIFRLPPAETAVHPTTDGAPRPQDTPSMAAAHLYLMCDDVEEEVKKLEAKGVQCSPRQRERWGIKTSLRLPSGNELGIYQPLHVTALHA